MSIAGIQQRLQKEGLYLGSIDSDWGPKTNLAHMMSLRAKGVVIPPWMLVAHGELGVREIPGPNDNPRIVEYHRYTSLKASDDETPWCSAYENFLMALSGLEGTNSAAARSWCTWGNELSGPRYGAVVIFPRGNSTWQGHVTNIVDWDNDSYYCLGGNQGDKVSVQAFRRPSAISIRWPSTASLAANVSTLSGR